MDDVNIGVLPTLAWKVRMAVANAQYGVNNKSGKERFYLNTKTEKLTVEQRYSTKKDEIIIEMELDSDDYYLNGTTN